VLLAAIFLSLSVRLGEWPSKCPSSLGDCRAHLAGRPGLGLDGGATCEVLERAFASLAS